MFTLIVSRIFDLFEMKKYLGDMGPFCGVTGTPVLDSWWRLRWVSKTEWAALFVLGVGVRVTHSLHSQILDLFGDIVIIYLVTLSPPKM